MGGWLSVYKEWVRAVSTCACPMHTLSKTIRFFGILLLQRPLFHLFPSCLLFHLSCHLLPHHTGFSTPKEVFFHSFLSVMLILGSRVTSRIVNAMIQNLHKTVKLSNEYASYVTLEHHLILSLYMLNNVLTANRFSVHKVTNRTMST